jgi:hypothetical protein
VMDDDSIGIETLESAEVIKWASRYRDLRAINLRSLGS